MKTVCLSLKAVSPSAVPQCRDIEGYVHPSSLRYDATSSVEKPERREGSFGDHAGDYTLPGPYSAFHIIAIAQGKRFLRVCRLVERGAMKYSFAMKREDIIRDIHGLDAELAASEKQYGLLSADFYHCYRAGELEQTRDFIRWAGYYEVKLEREASARAGSHVSAPQAPSAKSPRPPSAGAGNPF